jgi:cell fate regulator YaaT (PSP1 superfamily)
MTEIVGISKNDNDTIQYYLIGNYKVKKGYNVLIKTDRGLEFAKIVTDVHPIDETKLNKKLPEIYKMATKEDYNTHKENIKLGQDAYKKCQQLVKKYKLEMKIMDAVYTFDRDQLIFRFYSDTRIDFRDLAKELASIYKTRIELRQIGVRDKAKEIGGYGSCGQTLCCKRFLNEFDAVSISMAKDQNLSLNPTKINGICGRLLCCLKYEDESYKECKEGLPNVGKEIEIENIKGKVISVDILNRSYKVILSNGTITEVCVDGKN